LVESGRERYKLKKRNMTIERQGKKLGIGKQTRLECEERGGETNRVSKKGGEI
jgi:hypothetical protein